MPSDVTLLSVGQLFKVRAVTDDACLVTTRHLVMHAACIFGRRNTVILQASTVYPWYIQRVYDIKYLAPCIRHNSPELRTPKQQAGCAKRDAFACQAAALRLLTRKCLCSLLHACCYVWQKVDTYMAYNSHPLNFCKLHNILLQAGSSEAAVAASLRKLASCSAVAASYDAFKFRDSSGLAAIVEASLEHLQHHAKGHWSLTSACSTLGMPLPDQLACRRWLGSWRAVRLRCYLRLFLYAMARKD